MTLSCYANERVFKVTSFMKVSFKFSTEWLPAPTRHGQVQYKDLGDNFV